MFETEDEDLKYTLKWLVPNSQKNEMEPIIITLESGGQYKEEKPHQGEEFGYVLSGSIYADGLNRANLYCKIILFSSS